MYNFTLSIPTKMHFGKGQVCQLPADIKRYTNRVLMVYGGGSIKRNGVYDDVCNALRDAGMTAADINGVVGFANGMDKLDAVETDALSRLFRLGTLPVISVKRRVGEGRAASAALSLAQGALLLHGDLREEHDAYLGGHRVSISADSLDNLLVISYAPGGSYTALVLSR